MSKLTKHTNLFTKDVAAFLMNQVSDDTRKAYARDLKHLSEFISQHVDNWNTVTITHLIRYRIHLESQYKPSTVSRRLACIKSWFRFLFSIGAIEYNPADHLKIGSVSDDSPTEGLTNDEVNRLLNTPDESTEVGLMHSLVLHLMLYTGIRKGELIKLTWEDLIEANGAVALKIQGKGRKVRTIPLTGKCLNLLLLYRNSRARINMRNPLITPTGNFWKPLVPASINYIVKKYSQLANISKKISPHSLRATAITNALEQGCDLSMVQEMAGWSGFEMAKRYDKRRKVLKNSAAYKINYQGEK